MNYKIGFITSNIYLDFELDILLQGTNFIVIDYTMLTHNVVEYCHHKGFDVFTYTNKNIYTYDLIKQFNIDGIISNCKLLLSSLKSSTFVNLKYSRTRCCKFKPHLITNINPTVIFHMYFICC